MGGQDFAIGRFDWLKTQGGPPPGTRRYAILRVAKIKTKGQLGAALAHNLRERDTPNADAERSGDNTVLKGASTGREVIAAWEARAPEKIRKNAVHALEYFVGASPEKMAAMDRPQQDAYFRKALDWFEAKHGPDNVLSAVVHRDETTPHLQLLVIPLDARGKLNARELVGGKATLSKMQTDFAREVGHDFGFERGRERSQATHQTIKAYYGRANAPAEADFSLPERRKGNVLGVGRENDEDWRQRATQAAREAIARTKAQYEDRLQHIERGAAQLLAGIKAHEKALRREVGRTTPEERRMAGLHMNGLLIAARTRDLSPTEGRELTEAVETVLGPEGKARLLQGDTRGFPDGATLNRNASVAIVLKAYDDQGVDVDAAITRLAAERARDQEARQQQERAKERPVVLKTFYERERGRDLDDGLDL